MREQQENQKNSETEASPVELKNKNSWKRGESRFIFPFFNDYWHAISFHYLSWDNQSAELWLSVI